MQGEYPIVFRCVFASALNGSAAVPFLSSAAAHPRLCECQVKPSRDLKLGCSSRRASRDLVEAHKLQSLMERRELHFAAAAD
jgi:hypothetical protein